MKLILQKRHEHYGKVYEEGDEIEVTKEEYEQITGSYLEERRQLTLELEKFEAPMKKVRK
jgi:hypothetical protein